MENTQLFRRRILSLLSLLGEIGPNEMVFLSISTALVQYIILSGVSSCLTYPSIPPLSRDSTATSSSDGIIVIG